MAQREEENLEFVFESTRAGSFVVDQRQQSLQLLHGDAGEDTEKDNASHLQAAPDWTSIIVGCHKHDLYAILYEEKQAQAQVWGF